MKKIGNFQIPLLYTYLSIIPFSILLMLFTTSVQSQDVQVEAIVTPRQIQLNERATLELKISGNTLMKHIGAPQFNFLPDFLAVPLHSKTTPHLVDKKIAVKMAWVYELIPQKIGEIVLSDIRFSYQGIPYLAKPGTIIVGAVDTYQNTSTGGIHKVQAEVNNQKPHFNEAIEYRFRYLYTTILPTLEPPTTLLPDFTGFLVEKLPDEKGSAVVMRGKTYQVQEYVRRLYPQKTGQILITSAQLKLPIKGNPKTLKTKPIPLNVHPLPEVGRPTNFMGAVGEYNITAQVDRNKLEVRKALTLTLEIFGVGNIKTVTPPKISPINGFRVETPIHVKGDADNRTTYTYVLIPLKGGILQIPAIEFAYFSPVKNSYQVTKTNSIPITVLPNPTDIVDTESDFPLWTLWLLLIPILAGMTIGGYLLYRAKLKSGKASTAPDTQMPPAEQAFLALQSLKTGKTGANTTSFGEALTRILHQYLCEWQSMPYRQLNITEVQEICQGRDVSTSILNELIDILTQCDYHRFAPVPLSTDERITLLSRTEAVIQHFESY